MDRLPIVVGVDGSAASMAAVDTAAAEARLRDCPLRVLHGFDVPYAPRLGPDTAPWSEDTLRHAAEGIVGEAVASVRTATPGMDVTGDVIDASAAETLVTASAGAQLLVVGHRGSNSFASLLAGSVAVHVAAHARCPVMVVRGRSDPADPIVLGEDGSRSGRAAIAYAFDEAGRRGVPLRVVRVWHHPSAGIPDVVSELAYDDAARQAAEEQHLAKVLGPWQVRHPGVRLTTRVVQGQVRPILLAEAAGAQLIVVGSRGRGGFAGLLLGSVSQAVLEHATCPVVIARASETEEHPPT